MLFEVPIETERLLLRPEALGDYEDIYRINTDPEVTQYVGDGSILSLSQNTFRTRLGQLIAKRIEDEYGLAAIILKETGQYIGACWLKYDDFLDAVELGYRYDRAVWGKGYATEAGTAVLQAGFQLPYLETVFACSHPANAASIRVLQKLGFEHVSEKYHPQAKVEVPIYQIHRHSSGFPSARE
ncbi:MAG: GNAT family N-acetyltransferase [Planctomycetota bacterium]|jgi:RimJ/RimL family protein N-acetyltransferase